MVESRDLFDTTTTEVVKSIDFESVPETEVTPETQHFID
jgi:hypothetical protein